MICRIDWLNEIQTDNIKAIDKAESIDVKHLSPPGGYEEFIKQLHYGNEKVDLTFSNIKEPDFTCEICEEDIVGVIYKLTSEDGVVYEQLCKSCIREIIRHGSEVDDYDEWERR